MPGVVGDAGCAAIFRTLYFSQMNSFGKALLSKQ